MLYRLVSHRLGEDLPIYGVGRYPLEIAQRMADNLNNMSDQVSVDIESVDDPRGNTPLYTMTPAEVFRMVPDADLDAIADFLYEHVPPPMYSPDFGVNWEQDKPGEEAPEPSVPPKESFLREILKDFLTWLE